MLGIGTHFHELERYNAQIISKKLNEKSKTEDNQ